ncbi:hypothetical protein CVS40_10957 [Lucilia cuprina]|nr:hypothetical protein CVS40_10957 [Lucilia cuprina]
MKEGIRAVLKHRIICIKIDTATRLNRSILGINAQFCNNNKIIIYTLAMIELQRKHTAANLSQEVEEILNNFDISKHQIYCVTSDNGRYMLKTVENLNDVNLTEVEECDFCNVVEDISIHQLDVLPTRYN